MSDINMIMNIVMGLWLVGGGVVLLLIWLVCSKLTKDYDRREGGWGTELFRMGWEYPLAISGFVWLAGMLVLITIFKLAGAQ